MFLATTAIEATWDTSRPILFLGEWCRRHSRREKWQKLDVRVHPYHWDEREKYNRDYQYLTNVYEKCLESLGIELNRVHSTQASKRYWRILIGPWLRFYIDALFDRFETMRTASETGAIITSWVLPYALESWAPEAFTDFYRSLNDDSWNHVLYAECGKALGIPASSAPGAARIVPEAYISNNGKPRGKMARRALERLGSLVPSKLNNYVFVSAYLPPARLARVQLSLRQIPYLASPSIAPPPAAVDHAMRRQLELDLGESTFGRLLGRLLPSFAPKNYLENYGQLRQSALLQYPQCPRAIFTANAYQADDGFKLWAAEQKQRGVPLIIGQHGGNMGLAHHNQTEDHQVRIADSFCSWGWTRADAPSITPMPALQLSKRRISNQNEGSVILVLASLPRYFYCHFSMPVAGQFQAYLEEQYGFVNCLGSAVKRQFRIRLNGDEYGWDIRQRFESQCMASWIDDTNEKLEAILQKSRLCIVTYNATVILQLLAANYPVVAYWNPKYYDIRSEASGYIESLKAAGILHDSYESAAALVNEIHNDIQSWWLRPELQNARAAFCDEYARTSSTWTTDWRNHLEAVVNRGILDQHC